MDFKDLKHLDRVKVTLEDQVVSYRSPATLVTAAGHTINLSNDPSRVTIEKVAPPVLPTTPGSVVWDGERLNTLLPDGRWLWHWTGASCNSAVMSLALQYEKGAKVIFDAGNPKGSAK